jgi:hypothetical protein
LALVAALYHDETGASFVQLMVDPLRVHSSEVARFAHGA